MNNPIFLENNKFLIEENCKEVIDILVYQLKNISNAFYFACLIRKKNIQIYKYSYETKSIKKIGQLDVISSHCNSMKYFYNPLNKQEYFFIINDNDEITIYLIKNEDNFKLIQKLNYINNDDINNNNILNIADDDTDSMGEGGGTFTDFNFLDVVYNQNDKNVYIIISYLIMKNGGSESSFDYYNAKSNNIFIFKDDKLNLIKTFKFDVDFDMNNLIYINRDSDKKYLINADQTNELILFELKSNYDNYKVENFFKDNNNKNQLANFIRSQCSHQSCIVYGKNNFDYLYIFGSNKLMIINFTEKKVDKIIDKIIDFKQYYITTIHNWNNNFIIFFQYETLCIYDINNNKIITQYKKDKCTLFQNYSFPDKNETLGIFQSKDKIECYFVKN